MVERSNKLEMVNITDDDIWNAEPALRPEDEIVLRKLHDVLQSTADDLKLLSGELSKFHEPGSQVKSLPTPMDEDFNEKVHIEEIVHAKFHGYKVVDKLQPTLINPMRTKIKEKIKSRSRDITATKNVSNDGIQVKHVPILQKPAKKSNLTVSHTKIIQINEKFKDAVSAHEERCGINATEAQSETIHKPTVAYKEIFFKYVEPDNKLTSPKPLKVQNMPSINIRGELKEQKVLQLNIEPIIDIDQNDVSKRNIAVITARHEPISVSKTVSTINQEKCPVVPTAACIIEPIRKFSKMSSCESSEIDSNNVVIPTIHGVRKSRPYRGIKPASKIPITQYSEKTKNKRNMNTKDSVKHSNSNLDTWKKKLNAVYGCPTSYGKRKSMKPDNKAKRIESKSSLPTCSEPIKNQNTLKNADYIPYSKLTVGGVRVSDIEKEISGIPNKNDVALGPILNKIKSRENSFHNESPRLDISEEIPKILTVSDENLLQEVLDIETKISQTLTMNFIENNDFIIKDQPLDSFEDQDSYADDFEDEKSDSSDHTEKQSEKDAAINLGNAHEPDCGNRLFNGGTSEENMQNKTLKLSLKKNVDVFEFVHNIITQDTGTQSSTTQTISPKETQTSPTNDKCNVKPIHNDLWPSIDPKKEVEKLFKLEKDFIKKLIVDEYGDLLEKILSKPSTSEGNQSNYQKNVPAFQKKTQTSPAHVKSVMTSPTRTKTRSTSPFALSVTVNQHTNPVNELSVSIEEGEDLNLSINLSSPRFSLRLPQTSSEVIYNLESDVKSNHNVIKNNSRQTIMARKSVASSSSGDANGDYSSSDISSLGEVGFKLNRFHKLQVPTSSELTSSTSHTKYSSDVSDAIIPLRSEGEISLGQINRRKPSKNTKSEGEASVGCLY